MSAMKQLSLLLLAGMLFLSPTVEAATTGTAGNDPNPQAKKLAETVSMVTGVAISPLMGVGAVGAYQWWTAPREKRADLPWFANPFFWVPALLLVGACFLKDTAGMALPAVLKKPFDVAETFEHKISGLVAAGAFVPIIVNLLHQSSNSTAPGASLSSLGFAAISVPNWLYNIMLVPLAMAAFFIVFLASNAINILILLSPFSTVDAVLKGFRTTILASVVGSSFVNPWMGALWALVIILFSWLIAGWSFRLSHFGVSFLWDFITGRKNRFHPDAKENKMFLGAKIEKVPTRTYGRLSLNEKSEFVFRYRPWLVLPPRTMILPPGTYETGRGLFYSEIMRAEGGTLKTIILLPPRYLGHEEKVSGIYHFAGTRDVGIRAGWAWFKSLFGGKRSAA